MADAPTAAQIKAALASVRKDLDAYEAEQAGFSELEFEDWPEPEMPPWDDEPAPNGRYTNGEDKLEPFKTIRASSWHGVAVPEVEFLDDRHLFPIGHASIFTGASGVGKTYVALQAAIASAAGLPWLGAPIRRGPTIFYSAEENLDVLHMRTAKICFAENIHLDRLADLHFIDLSEIIDASLINMSRTSAAVTTDLYRQFDMTMGVIRPVSAWVDNKGLVITGNESDRTFIASSMRACQLLAGKHACAFGMLAHPSNTGMNSGTGASGSTAAFAGVRSVINMTKPDGEDADPDARMLDNNKTNYAKTGTQVNIKWQLDHYICTDIQRRAGDEIGKMDKAERVFLKLLRWHIAHGLEVSPNKNSPTFAALLFEAHKEREGLNRKWFKMAMDNLLNRRLIEVAERGPPSKRVKYLREFEHV